MSRTSHPSLFVPSESLTDKVDKLVRMSNLSMVIKEILKGWIEIQRFVGRYKNQTSAISNFKIVTEEKMGFLDQLAKNFEGQLGSNQEYLEAISPLSGTSQDYDRTVFRSIRLYGARGGNSFLFPWHPFVEAHYSDDTFLLERVVENISQFSTYHQLGEFIDMVILTRAKTRVRLSSLGVQFLDALVDLSFATTEHLFPSQVDLAKYLGCSEKAICYLQKYFSNLEVIAPRYLANYGKLGFQATQVTHTDSLDQKLKPFTIRTYRLDRESFVSIIYLPIGSNLVECLSNGKITPLTHYCLSRNLEQLHTKPELSWTHPVRMLGMGKDGVLPLGIQFDLTTDPNPPQRPLIDFSIIDQIQLVASESYRELATTLDISEVYVKNRFRQLIQEGIIAPFYFISRVGLDSSLAISFGDELHSISQEELIASLSSFPYAEMFYGPKSGIAILKVPSDWVPLILERTMELRQAGMDIWGTVSFPIVSCWGIPLANIVHKDGFFGIRFD